jgi:ABC-type antimicrobial peptide transport system permease subunit
MLATVGLAGLLAWRSLRHHRVVALATILGVAIGMTVVCAVLIVDNNTRAVAVLTPVEAVSKLQKANPGKLTGQRLGIPATSIAPRIESVGFERNGKKTSSRLVPTQQGKGRFVNDGKTFAAQGEEDYVAMRLAVRLASLLSFLVGAVIVFSTMRFFVAARAREFCLLLCLGESRAGVAASLLLEAAILGVVGTIIGLLISVPAGRMLLVEGISTTGQRPEGGDILPWPELISMTGISVTIALLGVAGPVRSIFRMEIAQILQPRFLSEDAQGRDLNPTGL